jgi:hypothetical protein
VKIAALPQGFPVGRLNLSGNLSRAINGRATGYTPTLPPMISPYGGVAPQRGADSTMQGDVSTIKARGKGTLSQLVAAKSKPTGMPDARTPNVTQDGAPPGDGVGDTARGDGVVRDSHAEAVKAASARQLLRERLADLRV